jgi:hypothetical protein
MACVDKSYILCHTDVTQKDLITVFMQNVSQIRDAIGGL